MENQGYEEDQSRAAQEQSTLESRRRDQQLCTDTIDVIDNPVVARATSHPESNLYEDIAIGAGTNTCELSKRTSYSDESRNLPETGGLLARQAWINRPSSSTIDRPFQQNSTLSSRISTNHDSIITLSRTNEDDAEKVFEKSHELPVPSLSEDVSENVSLSLQANEDSSQDASVTQFDRRLNRRRRKKDCKHCRSKLADVSSCEKFDELIDSKDTILKENGDNHRDRHPDASTLLFRESLLRPQNIKVYPIVSRTSLRDIGAKRSSSAAFPASEYGVHRTENAARFLLNMENDKMLGQVVEGAQNKILGVSGNGTDMRINSIYSQDRWYNKESQIFYTDVKDQNPFQRAYSLPARTHTPTSQNRANLRRSVRNEPPPQPARLDKHRRGWTLHLARPLKASGCSSPLIPLLIVVLILLGVAGVALYIVFEPEKLQIIQQYLKSSTSRLTGQNVTSGEPITPTNDESNLTTAMTDTMTLTSMTDIEETFAGGMFAMSAPISGNLSFPGSTSPSNEGLETEAASQNVINATRYCDDCFEGELCVAIFGEMVPICRKIRDHNDPTGCGGFCTLNRQKCHRLDVDAFRCERVERFFCLENEWTCSNTLCIPLDKRCDGHMNCYDHSDEFDCVCNLETHFQCGNKTSCLPLERRCDRKIDCWDATDEINCTLVCSLEDEFTCINGECIQRDRFCDGLADCSDGTDEPHGCQGRCNKHEFTCQNSRCIAKRMKCNGFDDCGDSSDEVHCKDRFI
ncbi:LRP2 protein, partial [Acromyrmex heyeri]